MIVLLNKPYGVLCQFTDPSGRGTLADYVDIPGIYPAGRLDMDSEGLVLLTDDGRLPARISSPRFSMRKVYYAQVEGIPAEDALNKLRRGLSIRGQRTRNAMVEPIEEPPWLWPRDPPIRHRKKVPTAWIRVTLREGRNRQVRRMTAAVGHPTLRLIRHRIGSWGLEDLSPGECREVGGEDLYSSRPGPGDS